MFSLFSSPKKSANLANNTAKNRSSFAYLNPTAVYFDSACQTLRPQRVINAEVEYYQQFNACGHRVKYPWGKKVDDKVEECRRSLLELAGKSAKDYTVAFCLNASHGMQLILHQLPVDQFDSVTTTNIEHSSVFLPSITWANRNNKPRTVIDRDADGSVALSQIPNNRTVFFANTHSNIDGQELSNIAQIAKQIRLQNGLVLIDACQTMGHHPELLADVDFDAVFGSGHKMYGPSIGFVIFKKSLAKQLDYYMLGGSTIADNDKDSYFVINEGSEAYSGLEAGLQNFAGITGLLAAIKWKNGWQLKFEMPEVFAELGSNLNPTQYEEFLAKMLHDRLQKIPHIQLITPNKTSTVSLQSDRFDGNKLAMYLGGQNIMCRSGYHCCYYYLKHQRSLPPLLRISIGLHNTPSDITQLCDKLETLMR